MTDNWDSDFNCPYCGADLVRASGNKHSDILIIGEFPGDEEKQQGIPMVGRMGTVLREQLAYLGLDLMSFRRTNLWLHDPNKNKECFQMGVEAAMKEAKGKKVILLMGSEVVTYFTTKKVSDVSGLRVTSDMLSAPIILAMFNPAIVFRGTIGETKFALKKFKEALEELK